MDTAEPRIPPGAVVVGVERSDGAVGVLQYGLAEGRRLARPVHVVAVGQPNVAWAWGFAAAEGVPVHDAPAVDLAAIRTQVDDSVTAAGSALSTSGTEVPAVEVHAVFGQPSEVLVACARDAALLVVGQPSRGLVGAALVGSVGLSCALGATCPVLVVPPPLPEP